MLNDMHTLKHRAHSALPHGRGLFEDMRERFARVSDTTSLKERLGSLFLAMSATLEDRSSRVAPVHPAAPGTETRTDDDEPHSMPGGLKASEPKALRAEAERLFKSLPDYIQDPVSRGSVDPVLWTSIPEQPTVADLLSLSDEQFATYQRVVALDRASRGVTDAPHSPAGEDVGGPDGAH